MDKSDEDYIDKLRKWSREYFENSFYYDNMSYSALSKVRDMMYNEQVNVGQRQVN